MRAALRSGVAAALSACAAGAAAWDLSISNTLRAEHYDDGGDSAFSPYTDLGFTGYDEFSLAWSAQPTPYSLWRALVSGVLNDSVYRSSDQDLVPERMSLLRESGEGALPYRIQAGDYFAFTSLRTQQRSLKGLSAEFQAGGNGPRTHSILLFGGAAQPSWRHLDWEDDKSLGASWLMEDRRWGRYGVNVLFNERGEDLATGQVERSQTVASVAAEHTVALGSMRVRAEGEYALMRGDDDRANTLGAPGTDNDDDGLFVQLSGFGGQLSWRLRGERYGRDYRPNGAVTPPDRRSAEAHVGWNFLSGLAARMRVQGFRDGNQSANPLDTHVVGVNLGGPVPGTRASGQIDAFVQEIRMRNGLLLDRELRSLTGSVSAPWFWNWIGQVSALRQEFTDRTIASGAGDRRVTEGQVSVIVPLRLGPLDGSVAPGLLARRITGLGAASEWQPTLSLALSGGPHSFTASFDDLAQDFDNPLLADVGTAHGGVDYRYTIGSHQLGLDAIWFGRDPDPGRGTDAYRIGASWAFYFDRRGGIYGPAYASRSLAPAAPLAAAQVTRGPRLLAQLAPGQDVEATIATLREAGITGAIREPRAIVYEVRLLPEIEQRQRLVLANDGPLIERAGLVIALGPGDGADDAARTFDRVRRALLDAFGAPALTLDEGAFGPGMAAELASGRFVRVSEWTLPTGTLRLGVPRRLDGQVRIEIQHAPSFESPRNGLWSLETVR